MITRYFLPFKNNKYKNKKLVTLILVRFFNVTFYITLYVMLCITGYNRYAGLKKSFDPCHA